MYSVRGSVSYISFWDGACQCLPISSPSSQRFNIFEESCHVSVSIATRKAVLTFIETKHTCCFRFSSAQWTPVNVQTTEASPKGANKKDLISAAGEKHCQAVHKLSGNIWAREGKGSAWGDRMNTQRGSPGEATGSGMDIAMWPSVLCNNDLLKRNTKVTVITPAKILTYCLLMI